MSSVCCVSSVGRPLPLLCSDANLEPACMQPWAGSASMKNRALPLHAAQKPTTQHGAPDPRPFILSHPCRTPPPPPTLPPPPQSTPPSRSLCAGGFSSSLLEVCMAEQWPFYPHETWNVSECSRLGPCLPSERALCPLFPPRETRKH